MKIYNKSFNAKRAALASGLAEDQFVIVRVDGGYGFQITNDEALAGIDATPAAITTAPSLLSMAAAVEAGEVIEAPVALAATEGGHAGASKTRVPKGTDQFIALAQRETGATFAEISAVIGFKVRKWFPLAAERAGVKLTTSKAGRVVRYHVAS
jgi:hypothetical protein